MYRNATHHALEIIEVEDQPLFESHIHHRKSQAEGLDRALAAARDGRVDMLEYLVSMSSDILHFKDDRSVTPAHVAAEGGQVGVLHFLAGMAPDTLSARDMFGQAPAHYAAKAGKVPALAELIAAEAEINSRDIFGYTPADIGRQHRRDAAVELLDGEVATRSAAAREGSPGGEVDDPVLLAAPGHRTGTRAGVRPDR